MSFLRNSLGLPLEVDQDESFNVDVKLLDVDGSYVDPATVTSITMKLYRLGTNEIINSHSATDVKGTGKYTISGNTLTIRLDPSDVALNGEANETHALELTVVFNDGTAARTFKDVATYRVLNLVAAV